MGWLPDPAVLVWVVACSVVGACLIVFGWCLRGEHSRGRGGMVDLSVPAARGELDLDWSDPRPAWSPYDTSPFLER